MIDRQIDRKQLVELRALALGSDRCWFQSLLFEDLTSWLRSGSYDLALHQLSFLICEMLRGETQILKKVGPSMGAQYRDSTRDPTDRD